jgi:hypothetical protein
MDFSPGPRVPTYRVPCARSCAKAGIFQHPTHLFPAALRPGRRVECPAHTRTCPGRRPRHGFRSKPGNDGVGAAEAAEPSSGVGPSRPSGPPTVPGLDVCAGRSGFGCRTYRRSAGSVAGGSSRSLSRRAAGAVLSPSRPDCRRPTRSLHRSPHGDSTPDHDVPPPDGCDARLVNRTASQGGERVCQHQAARLNAPGRIHWFVKPEDEVHMRCPCPVFARSSRYDL